MEELNNGEKLSELLDWIGCKDKNITPIHENKRKVLDPLKNAYYKRPMMDVLGGR